MRSVEIVRCYREPNMVQCRQCEVWFVPQRRNRAIYCSTSCRVTAHQQRQTTEARAETRGEEETVEIAPELIEQARHELLQRGIPAAAVDRVLKRYESAIPETT